MNVGDAVHIIPRLHGAESKLTTHGTIIAIDGDSARVRWADGLESGIRLQFLRPCPVGVRA